MLGILRRPFAPKKSRPRKWPAVSMVHRDFEPSSDGEYGMDVGPITVRLGPISATFSQGQWQTEDAGMPEPNPEIEEENTALREENNMLKLKVELLLDMLADSDGQRPDIDEECERQRADPCSRFRPGRSMCD